ncbi:hypothetical protein [uncultured Helicobacter sp.]
MDKCKPRPMHDEDRQEVVCPLLSYALVILRPRIRFADFGLVGI